MMKSKTKQKGQNNKSSSSNVFCEDIFVSKIGQANFSIVKTGEMVFPTVVPVLPPPQLQGENKILLKL